MIKGQITYHDSGTSTVDVPDDLRLPAARRSSPTSRRSPIHGTSIRCLNVATCEAAARGIPDAALFEGTYRSQDTTLPAPRPGRFNVLVFDQGEPGRARYSTGDASPSTLTGPYPGYTRGGYIEGGNIQVED